MRLNELKEGDKAIIECFDAGDEKYVKKLLSMGMTCGTEITIVRFAPLGDPVEIKVRGSNISLRKSEASIIKVRRV